MGTAPNKAASARRPIKPRKTLRSAKLALSTKALLHELGKLFLGELLDTLINC